MRNEYRRILQTEAVEEAQRRAYGRAASTRSSDQPLGLGEAELAFIAARDSFYLASISAGGWPYLQHRGGATGFLRAVGDNVLAFADLEGNRQLISSGNIAGDGRVSLFLMDYRARERLKVLGRARVGLPEDEPEIASKLGVVGDPRVRRIFVIEVIAYDWNCPKYIAQRFSRAEVEEALLPFRKRIEELEAALRLVAQ